MKNLTATLALFLVSAAFFNAPCYVPALAQGAKARPKAAALAPLKRRPGFIVGRCVDGRGKPLRGVRIRVFGTTSAGERTNYQTTTGANGQYAIQLPRGNFMLAGRTSMRLRPPARPTPSRFIPLMATSTMRPARGASWKISF